jgi:hypothetical protein
MDRKDLTVHNYKDLIFRCTNLSELRDEEIYRQIKMDTQREYLLVMFFYNIVRVYINTIYYQYAREIEQYTFFKKEFDDFIIYFDANPDKNKLTEDIKEGLRDGALSIVSLFYTIFDSYDETFNSRIILENLCEIKLTQDQFHEIILYFFDKFRYLKDMLEPYHNSRSLIIKNFYLSQEPTVSSENKLPLKDSSGSEYKSLSNSGTFGYKFNENFKTDIINKNWSDGYNFYWKESDENDANKDPTKCLKYLVEILTPDNQQIISMTVTRIPTQQNKQIHFYIKKTLSTQIKYFINKTPEYKNISLIIHSFATWLFNADLVYSNLMYSMKVIFKKNNVTIEDIDYYDTDLMQDLARFCIRGVTNKIIITPEFRNLWIGTNQQQILLDGNVKIYKLEEQTLETPQVLQGGFFKYSNYKQKYLKYKQKYIRLKQNYTH